MIKKQITFLVAMVLSISVFSQKSELKEAEKALNKKQYTTVEKLVKQAEPLIDENDAKMLAKFYYLKGMALYANGTKPYNLDKTIEAFNEVKGIEFKNKIWKYSPEINGVIETISKKQGDLALQYYNEAVESNDKAKFVKAADGFEKLYKLKPKDTTNLYYAASLNVQGEQYQKSIDQLQKLLNMGYTGIATIYSATTIDGSSQISYSSQKDLDYAVKIKTAKDPKVTVLESKYIDMIKSISASYIALDKNEKALEFVKEARKSAPEDYNLIIQEANIYFALGDNEMFKAKLEEAIKINPTNANLYYNVGVLNRDLEDFEAAKINLEKSIELDPNNPDAYNALGNIILNDVDAVQKEMDKYSMNFAKYDKIKEQKLYPILKEALPYLEKSYELKKDEVLGKQIDSIYMSLGMSKRVE